MASRSSRCPRSRRSRVYRGAAPVRQTGSPTRLSSRNGMIVRTRASSCSRAPAASAGGEKPERLQRAPAVVGLVGRGEQHGRGVGVVASRARSRDRCPCRRAGARAPASSPAARRPAPRHSSSPLRASACSASAGISRCPSASGRSTITRSALTVPPGGQVQPRAAGAGDVDPLERDERAQVAAGRDQRRAQPDQDAALPRRVAIEAAVGHAQRAHSLGPGRGRRRGGARRPGPGRRASRAVRGSGPARRETPGTPAAASRARAPAAARTPRRSPGPARAAPRSASPGCGPTRSSFSRSSSSRCQIGGSERWASPNSRCSSQVRAVRSAWRLTRWRGRQIWSGVASAWKWIRSSPCGPKGASPSSWKRRPSPGSASGPPVTALSCSKGRTVSAAAVSRSSTRCPRRAASAAAARPPRWSPSTAR